LVKRLAINNVGTTVYLFATLIFGESARWLLNIGKTQQAIKVLNKWANVSNVEITEIDWNKAGSIWTKNVEQKQEKDESVLKRSYIELFKYSKMRRIVLLLMLNWFCFNFIYYGLSVGAQNLSGNVFINNAINGLFELAAYILLLFTLDKFGRKTNLVCSSFIAGFGLLISMLMTIISTKSQIYCTTSKVFSFIGKFGASASFAIIFQYTNELFPTCLRSNGMAVCVVFGRIGSFIAMYLIDLQKIITWLPNLLFGVSGIIAGISSLYLPETSGLKLVDTIEEALDFYKNWKQNKQLQSFDNINFN